MAKTTINARKAIRKLQRYEQAIIEKGTATVSDLGLLGKNFAKNIVPYDTGFTYKSIRKKTIRRVEPESKIFNEPSIRPNDVVHRGKPRQGGIVNFNLVRWMHTSPKARSHIKSGDPQFMYTTREYLNGIKGDVARGRFKTINIK